MKIRIEHGMTNVPKVYFFQSRSGEWRISIQKGGIIATVRLSDEEKKELELHGELYEEED